jgi:hypothetical protein
MQRNLHLPVFYYIFVEINKYILNSLSDGCEKVRLKTIYFVACKTQAYEKDLQKIDLVN